MADKEEDTEEEEEEEEIKKEEKPGKKGGRGVKMGVALIIIGLIVYAVVPVWAMSILPSMTKLPDNEKTYDKEYDYEGIMQRLDPDTYQLVTYDNARGVKYTELRDSDDDYVYVYANITLYDDATGYEEMLTETEKQINRVTYDERFQGEERPYSFPIGTEKKTYEFGNPFVPSHLNSYEFETEEKRGGLDCYRFRSVESDLDYGTHPDAGLPMTISHYEEIVWIYPPTGSTIDQDYNVTVVLEIPDDIADLPENYESYTNYTGTYTVLDTTTFQPNTIDASGVLHIEAVGVDGDDLDLEGDLSLYAQDGSLIEVMAEINTTLNKHTHNMVVDGEEVAIDYNTTGYQAPNALIPGYTNDYTYVDSKDFGDITTYHYLAEELDIPYDQELPPGLPADTHLYLNYIEDVWVDPITGITLDQVYGITALLVFSTEMADLPEDYDSYTNYTGDFMILDTATLAPVGYDNVTGSLHAESQGLYQGSDTCLNLTANLSVFDGEGNLVYVLIPDMQKLLNKHTHNYVNDTGGDIPGVEYDTEDYEAENPMVPGHMTAYAYLTNETKNGVSCYVYEADEAISYDQGVPDTAPTGSRMYLNYYEKIWVEPATGITVDQQYNISTSLQFPDLEAFPPPDVYDPADQMFDEQSGGLLYIYDGGPGMNVTSQVSGCGMDATFLGYHSSGLYMYNLNWTFADGQSQEYDVLFNPYTAEITDFGGAPMGLLTFPVGIPDPMTAYGIWDPDMNMTCQAIYREGPLDYHGVQCMVYEYAIENESYTVDRTFGSALGPMVYNATVTYYVDAASGLVVDIHRTVTKYAPGASFNVTGTPLTNDKTFFHIGMNYTGEVIDGRILGLMPQLRESVYLSEQNMTAMSLDAVMAEESVQYNLALIPNARMAATIAGMGYQAPAKVINARYTDATIGAATATAAAAAKGMSMAGQSIPAMVIDARYTGEQVKESAADAKELESQLSTVSSLIPTIIAVVATVIFIAGIIAYVKGRRK